MSISTQLTRLARNVGALTADTNAIFEALRAKGVNVPANAQLSNVADMVESIEVPITSVEIGGRSYPVVQIGNRLWLAENLDLINSQVTGSYPNNDSQTYGYNGLKYGAYYNEAQYTALSSYIQTNYPGWRVTTEADYKYLDSFIGSSIGMDLCSTTEWNSTQGNDTYGLNLRPSGYITYTNTFSDEHNAALLRYDTGHCWIMPSYSSFEYYKTDQYTGPCSFNVRLVHDIT